jgi:ADP-heptose:LPS heptosyltransferase
MMKLKAKRLIDFYVGGFLLLILYAPVRLLGIVLRRNHQLQNVQHLAVIKMLGGGSLFSILPTLLHLKQKNPSLKLTAVCSPSIREFAKSLEIFDHVQLVDDRSLRSMLRTGLQTWWYLFTQVDTTLDLEIHSRMTTCLTTLSMAKDRIGLIDAHSQWRRRIYTHAIYVLRWSSAYACYDAVAQLFGIHRFHFSIVDQHVRNKIIHPSPLQIKKPYLALGIFCSDLGQERELPVENWIQGLEFLLQNTSEDIVFLGGPRDKIPAEKIAQALPSSYHSRLHILCGKTSIPESIDVLSQAKALIGIDTALMHLAGLVQVPQFGFWGPTNPKAVLRPSPVQHIPFYKGMPCAPCVHVTDEPPCLGKNLCMHWGLHPFHKIAELIKEFSLKKKELHQPDQKAYEQTSWVYLPNGSSELLKMEVIYNETFS